jgi:3-hydroxyisobutyrate dehydrogenase-like beta-hydroxyacid dehydrogenase
MKIGFIGLGTMGEPMAGHLLASGAELTVWNRSAGKADALKAKGASVAASPADLAAQSEVIVLCVNRTEDVQEVIQQIKGSAKSGTLIVDHSTIAPAAATEMEAELRALGLRFVDAPITGGSMGAQKGQLTIFMGGSDADCTDAITAVKPYTKRAERVGGPGAGQMAKMANQIAVGAALLGLCECLTFAEKAGLDLPQIKDMIGGGAGGSWAFDNYGPKVLAHDWSPGFSIKNQRKDFAYCRQAAKELDAAIPGTELVDDLLKLLQEEGRGEQATVALFEVLERSPARD